MSLKTTREKFRALIEELLAEEGRDWQLDFGPLKGKKGEEHAVHCQPGLFFRAEKLMATDTSREKGRGTRIRSVLVGARVQQLGEKAGMLTSDFANASLAYGLKFDDDCMPWETVLFVVEFLEDCTFQAVLFGKAGRL